MDGWSAPQWANFDDSVKSDVDQFFNVIHEDLEVEPGSDLQYHSCPSTPNSKNSDYSSPCKTPDNVKNSRSSNDSLGLCDYMNNLQLRSGKKLSRAKASATPKASLLKKACLAASSKSATPGTPMSVAHKTDAPTNIQETEMLKKACSVVSSKSATPGTPMPVAQKTDTPTETLKKASSVASSKSATPGTPMPVAQNTDTPTNIQETEVRVKMDTIIPKKPETPAAALDILDNSDLAEDENADCNTTIIAAVEKDSPAEPTTPSDTPREQLESEKIAKDLEDTRIIEETENISDDIVEEDVFSKVEEPQAIASVSPLQHREEKPLENTNVEIFTSTQEVSKPIIANRKNIRSKPTVLTSQARRQSTSKYRRRSGKYVSLAEAVSRFQYGTPERFRSSKAAPQLQKVRNVAAKLTSATSPHLRCKYRVRPIAVPSQEEREIQEMEKARKNRIKPNPIKQSVMNPAKKLKKNESTEAISKVPAGSSMVKKSTAIPVLTPKARKTVAATGPSRFLLNKMEKLPSVAGDSTTSGKSTMTKPPRNTAKRDPSAAAGISSLVTRRPLMNPPKVPQKIDSAASTSSSSLLSLRKTMTNPEKALSKCFKSTSVPNSATTTRRTMLNPPKSGAEKMDKSNRETRKTMMNPPKALPPKNPTKSTDSESASFKRPIDPPTLENQKSLVEPLLSLDMDDSDLLSKTIGSVSKTPRIPDSARKHTPCKKKVVAVVSTDEGPAMKDVEIVHFGVPVGGTHKKITKPEPFSFELRSQKLQSKREKAKKDQRIEDDKKPKTFHARPVPSFVLKAAKTAKATSEKTHPPVNCPSNFQERNEMAIKRKKEMFEQIVEREKLARVFHAKPAPHFPPVFVRGSSAENLRVNVPAGQNDKISKDTRHRGRSHGSIMDNQENTAPNTIGNRQIPKFKDALIPHNLKIKKTAV